MSYVAGGADSFRVLGAGNLFVAVAYFTEDSGVGVVKDVEDWHVVQLGGGVGGISVINNEPVNDDECDGSKYQ